VSVDGNVANFIAHVLTGCKNMSKRMKNEVDKSLVFLACS